MSSENLKLKVSVASLLVGVLGLALAGWTFYSNRVVVKVPETSEFYCSQRADGESGGKVWTVLYKKGDRAAKPWLRMVRNMGEGWNTLNRCDEIADRMNLYKEDGLTAFEYKPFTPNDPAPQQYVICAKTRLSEGCHLVVTLWPGDAQEAYAALQEVTKALMPGNPASYQTSAEITVERPTVIPLEDML